MSSKITYEFADTGEIIDSLHSTVRTLKAFNSLLEATLYNVTDLRADAWGICKLLDQQVYDLEQIDAAFSDQRHQSATPQAMPLDAALIAARAGTSKAVATRVLYLATGVEPAQAATDLGKTVAADARATHLLKMLHDGLELDTIAAATALPVDKVKSVIDAVFMQDTGDTPIWSDKAADEAVERVQKSLEGEQPATSVRKRKSANG